MESTFAPTNVANMSDKEKEYALESLIFLKYKYGWNVKGKACADSLKKWKGSQKKNNTPPKVALELILITSEIDAHERGDVAVVKITW